MRVILLIISLIGSIAAWADTIRVSPGQSIADAVRQARELRRTGGADAVTIRLLPGTYRLYEPLRLRPEDSGLTIEGQGATISGGVEISRWRRRGKTLEADVPDFNGRPLDFRQMWIGSRKAVRARDVSDFEQMHRIMGYDRERRLLWVPRQAVERIVGEPYAEMVLHQMWCTANLRISHIDVQGDSAAVSFHQPEATLQFSHPWPSPMTPDTGHPSPFYLTGAQVLLDEPGEWHLDLRTRRLSYRPLPGETLPTATVPALPTLVEITGTAEYPVSDITFKDVQFAHTTWMRPSEQGHVPLQAGMFLTEAYKLRPHAERPDNHRLDNQAWLGRAAAAVELRYTRNVCFSGCLFSQLGGSGLDFVTHCKGGTVSACTFTDIAMNGLVCGSFSPEGLETHRPYRPADFREVCTGQRIEQSAFCNIGSEDWGCVAIAAGYVAAITISHNEIHHVPYTAISLGWGWNRDLVCMRDNVVCANLIYDFARHTYDCAGIYTLGNQPGTLIAENVVRDIARPTYVHAPDHWFWLYTDEGSSNITLRDNWTPTDKYLQNANGPANRWENNGPQVSDSIRSRAGITIKPSDP